MAYQVFYFLALSLLLGSVASIPPDGSQVPGDCLRSHAQDYLRQHEYSEFTLQLFYTDNRLLKILEVLSLCGG